MLTRIEIDGFKTFERFSLDLQPFTAIVGPNASGKSNLFDALKFLSLLVQTDIRGAMQGLRGEPEELFRRTASRTATGMSFAVEVLLGATGVDPFGTEYQIPARRVRYQVTLGLGGSHDGTAKRMVVREETCVPLAAKEETAAFVRDAGVAYGGRKSAFIEMNETRDGINIRQDGPRKSGVPRRLSLRDATQTALSTITTAEFPHLHALREILSNIRFLEINPRAARDTNDRFEDRVLRADASNLAAVLAHLKAETADVEYPNGVLTDIATDLAWLIPSVRGLTIEDDPAQRTYAFGLEFVGDLTFSSRVISDGTLRLLSLLTVLNDPSRRGSLCFEEPENGIHEGRISYLIELLRKSTGVATAPNGRSFQIILNSHSPKVMEALHDTEIVAADSVVEIDRNSGTRASRTRMRTGVRPIGDIIDPERTLTRFEVDRLLRQRTDAA